MLLDSIFKGDFSVDEFSRPKDPEYQEVRHQISTLMDCLEKELSTDHTNLVKELLGKLSEAQYVETCHFFKIGFSAGLLLQQETVEVLDDILIEL